MSSHRRARIATACGLVALLVAIGVALARSPTTVVRINIAGPAETELAEVREGRTTICQAGELLPAGTTAIRLALFTNFGPRIALSVYEGGHVLLRGAVSSGWTSREVTVPVKPLGRALADARICASFQGADETVSLVGEPKARKGALTANGRKFPAQLLIEYLKPGRTTWASLVSSIARHLGMARAAEGTWLAFLALVLVAGIVATVSVALKEELL